MGITDSLAATHLGKKSEGSELYDKSLLVAVPREENRSKYSIDDKTPPFTGYDVWNCYEVSFTTSKGIPCNYVMKIKYPATSKYIVESKSLKLYLNSFNMTPLRDTVEESVEFFKVTVERDLSSLLEAPVDVYLHSSFTSNESLMFKDYTPIQSMVDLNNIECTHFKESPELLKEDPAHAGLEYKIHFDALRSNCRITHQPDFGDLFIRIKADRGIDLSSLLQYLVSFRKEWHFHEECVEMIYKRLLDRYEPEYLIVGALYTRRGGIDICPIRASSSEYLDRELLDISKYTRRTIKQ